MDRLIRFPVMNRVFGQGMKRHLGIVSPGMGMGVGRGGDCPRDPGDYRSMTPQSAGSEGTSAGFKPRSPLRYHRAIAPASPWPGYEDRRRTDKILQIIALF